MKICVAGLGLIGGSLCLALKRAGYFVAGYNRSVGPLEYALANGFVDEAAEDFSLYDIVFVAFPPRAAMRFIAEAPFKRGAVVADICGVKGVLEKAAAARKDIRYVGTHPMAGKEVSGIENACADLFDRASMVITRGPLTDEGALALVKQTVKDMGFARIVECSAEVHDKKIAYTSQLAHVVSNCYVKDDDASCCFGFTGGSFQDMTRIAGVDENVWTELYALNAEALAEKVDNLAAHLNEISAAVKAGDERALKALLKEGRERFEKFSPEQSGEIKITRLK